MQDWNKDILNVDDYYSTPEGMKNLAASCMLIEAIGEGVKQIDKLTQSRLLDERPEIPWQDVIGIRNHIAHGYFDIDGDIVLDVIKIILTSCWLPLIILSQNSLFKYENFRLFRKFEKSKTMLGIPPFAITILLKRLDYSILFSIFTQVSQVV